MTNVIPFAPRAKQDQPTAEAEARVALAAELIELVERVKEMAGRAASLSGPSLRIEQTAQDLLDAATALERATASLTEDGEWVPF